MKEIRRARLGELLSGPRFNGDRAAFCRAADISKGRLTQLLDPKEPFGDVAARNLSDNLGLNRGWFDAEDKAPKEAAALPQINERRAVYRFVSVESAVEAIANHLHQLGSYDQPTAVSLMTLLINDPDMHAAVANGLKKLKPQARGAPEKQTPPAYKARRS